MSAYLYRLAKPEDLGALTGLLDEKRLWLEDNGHSPDDVPDTQTIMRYVDMLRVYVTVCPETDAPHIVSCALVNISEGMAFLTYLMSDIKGCGAAMLSFVETALSEEGYEKLYVTSPEEIQPYFLEHGYNTDGILLSKELDASDEEVV